MGSRQPRGSNRKRPPSATYAYGILPSIFPCNSHHVQGDPDAPGDEVYEIAQQPMKVQTLADDPADFIPAYKKELGAVT